MIDKKITAGFDKNSILVDYNESCIEKGIASQVSTIVKGEKSPLEYPSHHCLIANCKMKPSSTLYYQVKILHFDNMVIFSIKWHELHLTDDNLKKLQCLNKKYCKMINNVLQLRLVDCSSFKNLQFDYAEQMSISSVRVDLAIACVIHYGLNVQILGEFHW
jgi:hypothetical protein